MTAFGIEFTASGVVTDNDGNVIDENGTPAASSEQGGQ